MSQALMSRNSYRLGKLCGKTPQELYRSVAELQRRDLVQQRSVWRAVLPHAIANRLAAVALQNIPYATIQEHLFTEPSGRLAEVLLAATRLPPRQQGSGDGSSSNGSVSAACLGTWQP